MIIWKGHGVLVLLFAVAGGVAASLAGVAIGAALNLPWLGVVTGFWGAASGAWLYVKTLGKTKRQQLIDPATGRPVILESAHTLYFLPVMAWAWIFTVLAAILTISLPFAGPGDQRTPAEKESAAAALTGKPAFVACNSLIATAGSTPWHGNSPVSIKLAERFGRTLALYRSAGIEQRTKKSSISLSHGQFLTYCWLTEDRCLFLTHVPDLRKFNDEAKNFIVESAWDIAGQCAADLDPAPRELVVGVRGAVLYEAVLVGSPPSSPDGKAAAPVKHRGSEASGHLPAYFQPAPSTFPKLTKEHYVMTDEAKDEGEDAPAAASAPAVNDPNNPWTLSEESPPQSNVDHASPSTLRRSEPLAPPKSQAASSASPADNASESQFPPGKPSSPPAASMPDLGQPRTWRDLTGREMQATLLRLLDPQAKKAEFRRADGKVFTMDTSKLSEEDRQLLQNHGKSGR